VRLLTCAFAVAACAPGAYADLLVLDAAKDNTLYEETSPFQVSNGMGESLFAGFTMIQTKRRALLAFDVSAIPAGSAVTSVTLTLHCTRSASGAEPVTLHRALASWGEGASVAEGEGGLGADAAPGDATWLFSFFPGQSWTAPGGDFDASALATTFVAGSGVSYGWQSAALAACVQSWVDQPATNHGFLLMGNEAAPQTAKRFASREHATPEFRPSLTVEYTPIPGPGSAAGLAVGAALAGRRRARQILRTRDGNAP